MVVWSSCSDDAVVMVMVMMVVMMIGDGSPSSWRLCLQHAPQQAAASAVQAIVYTIIARPPCTTEDCTFLLSPAISSSNFALISSYMKERWRYMYMRKE